MRRWQRLAWFSILLLGLAACLSRAGRGDPADPNVGTGPKTPARTESTGSAHVSRDPGPATEPATAASALAAGAATPLPAFVAKGLAWLVEAQHESGGWGSGSHASQQLRDPRQVVTDPATTAFAASALLRAGHDPVHGDYRDAVRRATVYLCDCVERSAQDDPRITDLSGTQPQAKLGPWVDTSMALQFLARVLPTIPEEDELAGRVDRAATKCLAKLQMSQETNGSWGGGGWAPVLQSALGCSALEYAEAAGKNVDSSRLRMAREYQKGNFDADSGRARADAAAGVELYAFAGAQKAAAAEFRRARDLVDAAKERGALAPESTVSSESLQALGVSEASARELSASYAGNIQQAQRLASDDSLLSGFGSNGGEEFLSYMLTSESLILHGGESWTQWNEKMHTRLARIQSADGSWTGHHCVTSPVFCTAAVVQCLTVERDLPLLEKISRSALVQVDSK
ncbi:MAG: hypothetical protein AB7O52_18300 [Planctomycetota bacterium]